MAYGKVSFFDFFLVEGGGARIVKRSIAAFLEVTSIICIQCRSHSFIFFSNAMMRIIATSLVVATSLCYAFAPFASTPQVRTSRRRGMVAWSTTSSDSVQNTRKLAAVVSDLDSVGCSSSHSALTTALRHHVYL